MSQAQPTFEYLFITFRLRSGNPLSVRRSDVIRLGVEKNTFHREFGTTVLVKDITKSEGYTTWRIEETVRDAQEILNGVM